MATVQTIKLAPNASITFQSEHPANPEGVAYHFTVTCCGNTHRWTGNGQFVEKTGADGAMAEIIIQAQAIAPPFDTSKLETMVHAIRTGAPHLRRYAVVPSKGHGVSVIVTQNPLHGLGLI